MTTANMLICPYNDHLDASLSVNVSLPAGFAAENTQNTRRDDVLLTNDTSTLVITGVLPENRTINGAWLNRHRLHGANWRLQLFSDTGASVPVSGGDTTLVPTLCYTATEPYTFSNGSNDPMQYEAPTWFYFAQDYTARSYKITVSGTPTAGSYFEIGNIFIGKCETLRINPVYGAQLWYTDLSRPVRTEGGTRASRVGEHYREWKGDVDGLSPLDVGTWMQIYGRNGTWRDVMISLFPGDGTSLERWNTMNCFMKALDPLGYQANRITKTMQFEES